MTKVVLKEKLYSQKLIRYKETQTKLNSPIKPK